MGGVVVLCISALLLVVIITKWEIDELGEMNAVIGLFCFFFLLGIFVMLNVAQYEVTVSQKSILVKQLFRSEKRLNWKDVETVEFSSKSGIMTIQSKSQTIHLMKSIHHFDRLLLLVKKHVEPSKIRFE